MKQIKLAHGNGGVENNHLIQSIFYKSFANSILAQNEDSAILENEKLAFCTDSFTVSPIFFKGGDIGKLSICGTCNDLAMVGASPKYLSFSVVIEEGFLFEDLEKIVDSAKKEIELNGAIVVTGDTKVMPKNSLDKIIINTSAIGELSGHKLNSKHIQEEDVVIISGDIGRHGAVIFAQREGMEISSNLTSDCKSLFPIVDDILSNSNEVVTMRDATRGGVSAVLNEWAKASNICIEIEDDKLMVCDEVQGLCELLGFEALSLANEGTFLIVAKKTGANKILEILKKYNQFANIIGTVTSKYPSRVVLKSSWGTSRFLDAPTGELLPRIC